jgi:hypothetical protein
MGIADEIDDLDPLFEIGLLFVRECLGLTSTVLTLPSPFLRQRCKELRLDGSVELIDVKLLKSIIQSAGFAFQALDRLPALGSLLAT